MATYDYSEDLADAEEMIAEFGQAGFVRRKGLPTGPPHNPRPGPPINTPVTFVEDDFSAHEIDGTRILAKDLKILMAVGVQTQDPDSTAELVYANGDVLKIVNAKRLSPGGTTLLFEVQARR